MEKSSKQTVYTWHKTHHESRKNAKLQSLRDVDGLFQCWYNLTCCVDIHGGGYLPNLSTDAGFEQLLEELPRFYSKDEAHTKFLVQALIDRGMIDQVEDGIWQVHDWDDHQSVNTDYREKTRLRVQRLREKRSAQKDGTTLSNDSNVTGNVTCNAQEEEGEVDFREDGEESAPPPTPASRPAELEPDVETDKYQCLAHFRELYPRVANDTDLIQAWDQVWGKPAPSLSMSAEKIKHSGIPDRRYYFSVVVPYLQACLVSEDWTKDDGRYIPDAVKFISGGMDRNGKVSYGRMWTGKPPKPSRDHIRELSLNQKPSFEISDDDLRRLRRDNKATPIPIRRQWPQAV